MEKVLVTAFKDSNGNCVLPPAVLLARMEDVSCAVLPLSDLSNVRIDGTRAEGEYMGVTAVGIVHNDRSFG